MASNTKQTELRRKTKRSNQGKRRKKRLSKMSTPPFPIHLEKDE